MKKHLLTISAILTLLVAGCEMFPPDESQIPVEIGTAPEIVIAKPASPESDSTFSVTIVPAEGTGYYAYLVVDKKMPDIDGSTLLSQDYEGLYGGLAEMSTTASVTIEANPDGGIMPGSLYYVYAVGANTSQGNPSPVAYDSVYTTNGNVPVFDDEVAFTAAEDGSYVDIALNDVVTLGEGKIFYDIILPNDGTSALPSGKLEVPADSITCSGKIVRIGTPANVPNGAIVNITWEEGAFVNSAKIKAKAYGVCTYNGLSYYANYGKYGDGILYRKATAAWNLNYPMRKVQEGSGENMKESWVSTAEDTIGVVNTATEGFKFIADSTISYLYANQYTVTYYKQDNSKLSYKLSNAMNFVVDDTTVVVTVDQSQVPAKGTWMSISVPEGIFEDQWGNPNAEFTSNDNFIISYGYEMKDIYGSYTGTASNLMTQEPSFSLNPSTGEAIVIRPLTKEESEKNSDGHNLVIENLLFKGTKVNAFFGKADGIIYIPGGQMLVEEYAKDMQVDGYRVKPIIENGDTLKVDGVIQYGEPEKFDASLVLYGLTPSFSATSADITLHLNSAGKIALPPTGWANFTTYSWASMIADGNNLVGFQGGFANTSLTRNQ